MSKRNIPRSLRPMKVAGALMLIVAFTLFLMLGSAFAGTATVGWSPVTKNTDGSTITDLAGYRVYYGTSQTTLDQVMEVPNPAATSATVLNLAEGGVWYFAVRAYNAKGTLSDLSSVASKSFVKPEAPKNVTVASLGYVLELRSNGVYRLVRNGSVPLGVECVPIPGNTTDWMGIAGDRIGICGPG